MFVAFIENWRKGFRAECRYRLLVLPTKSEGAKRMSGDRIVPYIDVLTNFTPENCPQIC